LTNLIFLSNILDEIDFFLKLCPFEGIKWENTSNVADIDFVIITQTPKQGKDNYKKIERW
jgi:hypothetical protein